MTASHPRFTLLADLADGSPGGAAHAAASSHAAACAPCGAHLAALRTSVAMLRSGAAAEPPEAWVRRALRVPARARIAAAGRAVRRFVATLVFDSRDAGSPIPVLRGRAARHLLYRAGPWEIDLAPGPDGLRGSVLPPEGEDLPPDGRARLVRRRRVVARADLDARGRFLLPAAPPAGAVLEIEFPGMMLRVEDLPA